MVKTAKNLPMAAAPLVWGEDGKVAWDRMWDQFCYLAIEGGPPHRGTMLVGRDGENDVENENYKEAMTEVLRAYGLLIPYPVKEERVGWIGVKLWTVKMAIWYEEIIKAENVECRREGRLVLLPVNDDFRLENEVKNVVTVMAKAYHYWALHRSVWEKFCIAVFGLDVYYSGK